MTKEASIVTIIRGDILRILAERKRKVPLDIIKEEIKASYSYISEAIEELKREDLIQSIEPQIS
jgi:DNA-binding IscR family transcriptional regulator